jgi:hypothetical protein
LDVAKNKFSKRELALSPCWLGKFLHLNIFQTAFGTVQVSLDQKTDPGPVYGQTFKNSEILSTNKFILLL